MRHGSTDLFSWVRRQARRTLDDEDRRRFFEGDEHAASPEELAASRVDITDARAIIAQAASALAYCHEAGGLCVIAWMDLSSNNMNGELAMGNGSSGHRPVVGRALVHRDPPTAHLVPKGLG